MAEQLIGVFVSAPGTGWPPGIFFGTLNFYPTPGGGGGTEPPPFEVGGLGIGPLGNFPLGS